MDFTIPDGDYLVSTARWRSCYVYSQDQGDGNVRGWCNADPGPQGHIRMRNMGRYYMISTARWPGYFVYMQDNSDGNVRTWDGDPGPQGHWQISVNRMTDETTFRMKTLQWPNHYMYMQDNRDGNVRAWQSDPGEQGWFILQPLGRHGFLTANLPVPRPLAVRLPDMIDGFHQTSAHNRDGNVRAWQSDPGEQGWSILQPLGRHGRLTAKLPVPRLLAVSLPDMIDGFHQTSALNKDRIAAGGDVFCSGNGGALEAAMYFATTSQDTYTKAHYGGWVAICKIDPGRCMLTQQWHPNMTKEELNAMGFDSIYIRAGDAASTPEYAIFD